MDVWDVVATGLGRREKGGAEHLALSSLVCAIHVEPSCRLALSVGTLVNPPSVGSEEAYMCAIQIVFSFSPSIKSSHCSCLACCIASA